MDGVWGGAVARFMAPALLILGSCGHGVVGAKPPVDNDRGPVSGCCNLFFWVADEECRFVRFE